MAIESIILLGHVNFSMNNMTRERIKNSFQDDLHSLCEAGNPPTTLLLGDDLPKKIRDGKESSKFTSRPLSQLPRYTGYQHQNRGSQEQQTQSSISPTIPEHQTIQELTNIVVSVKPIDILSIRTYFRSRSNEFKAGKLKRYFHV